MEEIGTVRPININEEMRGSYLDYAMSVIVAALCPMRVMGLKPVHRRILFAMHEMGLRYNSTYKKSARVVGDVLGKYHPHGDSAVYEAMARMVQDFSLRYPLVDGQGISAVSMATARSDALHRSAAGRIAEELLVDIGMETVNFVENYDGTQQEPEVLPARLPNLLLNGTSGIAVGMATSIPPHNLRELAAAITFLIDHYATIEDISVDDLLEYVHGPDFPTGATIIADEGLKEAYATGRGRVVVRAKYDLEEMKDDRHRIVFTEIPYQVSKTAIVERIVSLVRERRIDAIADLRDESDRNGMRLAVELKRGAQPLKVLNQLYKFTQLQSTFSIQMLALVNGEPRTLGLKRALQIYIEHRYDVIVRRSEYELNRLRARAHILEGLLKALSSIDQIIQTIRSSPDTETARAQLMNRFDLSEAQSNAILEMQLRRLAALEQQKLKDEYDEVMSRIAYLEDLLSSPEKILALIRDDLNDLAETFGDERRTEIMYGVSTEFNEADLVHDERVVISLTTRGYIKRVPADTYRSQRRGGKGIIGMATREEDGLHELLAAGSLDYLLFFSDWGKVYCERAFSVPETSRTSRGTLVHSILPLAQDEQITAILPVADFDAVDGWYFVMATRLGRIKRVNVEDFAAVRPSGLIAISLDDGDTLNWVKYSNGDQSIMLVTEGGQAVRFHEEDVRVMGRPAGGVNAIRLAKNDVVAGMDVVDNDDTHLLVVTQHGHGKRTALDEYAIRGRYAVGVRTLARNQKTGPIVAMRCIKDTDNLLLMTENGVVLRTQLDEIRQTGRSTQGVVIMNLTEGDRVVGLAVMDEEEDDTASSNGSAPSETQEA